MESRFQISTGKLILAIIYLLILAFDDYFASITFDDLSQYPSPCRRNQQQKAHNISDKSGGQKQCTPTASITPLTNSPAGIRP